MAYKISKGSTVQGDIKGADDSDRDTIIDFGEDRIDLQTNGTTRLKISGSNGAVTLNEAYTFPHSDGNRDQVLATDGAGAVSWVDPGAPPPAEVLKVGLSSDYTFSSTTANEPQTVPFNNVIFDTFPGEAGWSTGGYKFISGDHGYYQISAQITMDDLQSDCNQYQTFLMTSGPGGTTSAGADGDYTAIYQFNPNGEAVDMHTMTMTTIMYLSSSQSASITVRQVGGTLNTTRVRGTAVNQSFVCVRKL